VPFAIQRLLPCPCLAETPDPTPASLAALQKAAATLAPGPFDRADMKSWAVAYITDPGKQRRIAYDLDYVRRYAPSHAEIVEYGAIPLMLTLALQESGFKVTGVDLAPERFQTLIDRLQLRVVSCDIERQPPPFAPNSCDLVTFNELFEHLRINPIFTMEGVFRILRPGGRLLLSTPNLRSLNGIINFLWHGRSYSCCSKIYEEYRKLDEIGHMGHVREFTPVEVCTFLGQIGFEVETVIFRGHFPEPWKQRLCRLQPALRPFMTIVARKPAATSA